MKRKRPAPPVISVKQLGGRFGTWDVLEDGALVASFLWNEAHKANGMARRHMERSGQPEGGNQGIIRRAR